MSPGSVRLRVVAGAAVASAAVLLLAVTWVARRDTGAGAEESEVIRVGVVQGQSVPGYLRSARAEMAALTGPSAPAGADVWALVSLDAYVEPDRLPGLLAGAAVAQVFARVPLPGVRTPVVRIAAVRIPADVAAGMLGAALARDQEQAAYLQLARRLHGDPVTDERARRAYGTAARTAGEEAAGYRAFCACLFAAVVRAGPAGLAGIAARAGVRAVDPAPEVHRPDRAEFRPPLPEQAGAVPPEPSTAPVPTGTSGIAPGTSAPILSSLGVVVTSTSPAGAGSGPAPAALAPEERVSPAASAAGGCAGRGTPGAARAFRPLISPGLSRDRQVMVARPVARTGSRP